MSAIALQRVVVRMLFDAAFCDHVYADPETALHDVNLTAQERQWLVTPDPRAYKADTYRSSRTLTGLLEEYPVAAALIVRRPQGLERLQRFFTSPFFHQCIQQRGSLAAAFGTYLASPDFAAQPEVGCIAAIEMAIAQVRRASILLADTPPPLTAATELQLAPWVVLLTMQPTTLQYYTTLLQRLQHHSSSVLQATLDTTWRLPGNRRPPKAAPTYVMVVGVPGTEGPSLEAMSDELAALLAAAQHAVPLRDLCAVAVRLGADSHEAVDIIQGCVTDRLLVPVS